MNPALDALVFALREHPLEPGRICFLGAEPHWDLPVLTGWQPLKPLAQLCEDAGMELMNAPTGSFQTVLFLPGKSKEEILSGYARAYDLLEPGGRLIVSLANGAGASRFEKELHKAVPILFSESKNKCRVFGVSKDEAWDQTILEAWRELGKPSLVEGTSFITVPGVFSAHKVDAGSAFLAAHLPASLRGHVADLGAGWGFLSKVALDKSPNITQIDLFEADARALECARHNVSGNVHFHWHDVTLGLPEKYDHIIMNPPFHSGQTKDVDLGKAFISVAAASLKRGGSLLLVANRQLPYEAHLDSLGLRSRLVAQDHAYKVIFSS